MLDKTEEDRKTERKIDKEDTKIQRQRKKEKQHSLSKEFLRIQDYTTKKCQIKQNDKKKERKIKHKIDRKTERQKDRKLHSF